MSSGAARIDEASTIEALRRRGTRVRPVPAGMLGALTVACWAVWIYLVLPLVSLVLWVAGVQLFVRESAGKSYGVLMRTLLSYSAVLVVLVGLLALWILWNVARYGGKLDRRYEGRGLLRNLFWAIWYPALYWAITAGTSVVALPLALENLGGSRHVVWRSPDR